MATTPATRPNIANARAGIRQVVLVGLAAICACTRGTSDDGAGALDLTPSESSIAANSARSSAKAAEQPPQSATCVASARFDGADRNPKQRRNFFQRVSLHRRQKKYQTLLFRQFVHRMVELPLKLSVLALVRRA